MPQATTFSEDAVWSPDPGEWVTTKFASGPAQTMAMELPDLNKGHHSLSNIRND